MYEYRASVLRVIDGDTLDAAVDLGFRTWRHERFRLLGINAPELHADDPAEREKAIAARDALRGMVLVPQGIVVQTKRDQTHPDSTDKYGRYLADIFVEQADGTRRHVNSDMIDGGFAVPYMVSSQLSVVSCNQD